MSEALPSVWIAHRDPPSLEGITMSHTVQFPTTGHEQSGAARTAHPPQPPSAAIAALERRSPRTAIIDRFAMRIGLWLLLWASRPTHVCRAEADARRERERLLRAHLALAHTGPRHPYA